MLWSILTAIKRVSTDQCHLTVLQAQVYNSLRWHVFLKFFADQLLAFSWWQAPWGGGVGVVLRISSDRDDGIGGKNQNPKKSLGLQTKPKKSHSEFPSYKNFQKALNET